MYIYGQSTFSYHFNVGILLLVHILIEQNAQNNDFLLERNKYLNYHDGRYCDLLVLKHVF